MKLNCTQNSLAAIVGAILQVLCSFSTAAALLLQQPEQFHQEINVEVVNIYVTALDQRGALVKDLRAEELVLTEDGVPQQITNFSRVADFAPEPLSVAILIDTSLSMNEKFQNVKKIEMAKTGGLLLLNQLKRGDEMLLIRFSDKATATGLISQKEAMRYVVQDLKADKGLTALRDAIDLAMDKLKSRQGQKLIFICSDGDDTASKRAEKDVIERLRNSVDTTVLTLGINAFKAASNSQEGQRLQDGRTLLQTLADVTGGLAFFPGSVQELNRTMEQLKSLILNQYFVGYHPANPTSNNSWRNVEIQCTRPGVKLKYRTGYSAK